MGVDYLPQKLNEYISVEATRYLHITHVTVATDSSNHVYTKSRPRFDDSWSVTSSAPGCIAVVV